MNADIPNPHPGHLPGCPDSEELSAWFDHAAAAPRVAAHVAQCDACRREIEHFRRLDAAVRAAIQAPPGLTARIQDACRREAGESQPARNLFRSFRIHFPAWRLAAAAGITALIGLMAWEFHHLNRGPATVAPDLAQAAGTPPTTTAGAVLAAAGIAAGADERTATNADPGPGTLAMNLGEAMMERSPAEPDVDTAWNKTVTGTDLRAVSVHDVPATGALAPKILEGNIRHVWVVADLQASTRLLRASLPKGARLVEKPAGDRILFQTSLKDGELQQLVNALAGAGCALVSPDLPQPDEDLRIHVRNKYVSYQAEMVLDDRP